jgi:hypothetical protein
MQQSELYNQLIAIEQNIPPSPLSPPRSILDYADLATEQTWEQQWDAESRQISTPHSITAKVWSNAIEQCLEKNSSAYLPNTISPIYIDRPIVLKSGNRLIAHPQAEIRLIIGAVGTCMVRNASVRYSGDAPVEMCAGADEDILIEGGIWNDQRNEGRGRGGLSDKNNSIVGSMTTMLLHNVSRVAIRNACFRDCSAFAVQVGNATDFLIENLTFDETADGIHVEGPAQNGIIRNIKGKTNDDIVALNAWDWEHSSITFGPITDILVENIEMPKGYTWSEIRLLPGTKIFRDGKTIDCDVRRCVFHNIRGIHTFKMYDQPNVGRVDEDYADPIGKISDLFFSDIEVEGIDMTGYYDKSSDGVFDICADIEGMHIQNVHYNYIPGQNNMAPYLISVGPKSLTWPKKGNPANGWFEVFNNKANPVVSGLTVKDVSIPDSSSQGKRIHLSDEDLAKLIHERCLTPNPDFPNTMPAGGTGHGRII